MPSAADSGMHEGQAELPSHCMLYALQAREIAAAGDEDPLDAFMAAEILPEVKQAEAAEAARREEQRRQLAQQRAVCACS